MFKDSILEIDSGGTPLLGILSTPTAAPPRVAMVLIVGGPQYRVGSHRQFALLARRLAAEGIAVLRFDYAGMGDSEGPQRAFTEVSGDVRAAIDALQARLPEVQAITLWGLCDGASAALLYCDSTSDPRVRGLCLLNPWVRSEASFARTELKHYYTARLKDPAFWRKLVAGKVSVRALGEVAGKVARLLQRQRAAPSLSYQQRMARAAAAFSGPILVLLSELDLVAREFVDASKADPAWEAALQRPGAQVQQLPGADHTCSNALSRDSVEQHTLAWHRALCSQLTDQA